MANLWFWILIPMSFILFILDRARQIKNGQLERQYNEKTLMRAKKFYKIACVFLGIVVILMVLQILFFTYTYFQDVNTLGFAPLLTIYVIYAHGIVFQLTLFPFFQENLRLYKRVMLVFMGVLPWLLFGLAVFLSEDKISKGMVWKYLSPSIIFWMLNFPSIFLSKPWMHYYMEHMNACIDYCAKALLKTSNWKIHK